MGYAVGEARGQQTLFPAAVSSGPPAETGRPGYGPRDLLTWSLHGYLQQVRSSRRLEAKCGTTWN